MTMTVEELSRRTGVVANTIRYYTRIGLLRPRRHPSNSYRLYGDRDLKRLSFIGHAKWLGLSLAEIRGLIQTAEAGGSTSGTARKIVAQRAADVSRQIAGLMELERELTAALVAWNDQPDLPQSVDSICPLIELYVPTRRTERALGRGSRFAFRASPVVLDGGNIETPE